MFEGSDRFDRRTVLKGIGTAALAAGGLGAASGSAAAIETQRRLADAYADEGSLGAAFERHGDGLRERLVAEGFVDPSFDFAGLDFEIDGDVTGIEPTAEDRLAGVGATREGGTFTAVGMVSTSTDTHELALFVQPERGEAYALVEPVGGGDTHVVSMDGVTPQGCAYSDCGDFCSNCYLKRTDYSCDPSCQDCWVTGTDCGCCVCDSEYC